MKLFTGNSNKDLAERISKHLGIPLSDMVCGRFSNQECQVLIKENVRKEDCYVVQTTDLSKNASPNDNIMELLIIVDALKRATANSVTVVIPCYGYQRQDRKDTSRAPVSAALIATLLEKVHVDRVITMDLHAGQIQGFFRQTTPIDNLFAENDLVDYIRNHIAPKYAHEDLIVVSPDEGGIKRATRVAGKLKTPVAVIHKDRGGKAGEIKNMTLLGDVREKVCMVVDDLLDSGNTACKCANVLMENGAKAVYMLVCHLVLSGAAVRRIKDSAFTEVVGTNTMECRFNRTDLTEKNGVIRSKDSKIVYVDISWLFAEAIKRADRGDSLKDIYENNITMRTISPVSLTSSHPKQQHNFCV